jgi:iron complex transport system substrate-binding protein
MKSKRNLFSFILVVLLGISVFFVGCENKATAEKTSSADSKSSAYPLTIMDSYNREVTIDKEPQRVISLAPNITEVIGVLNKLDKLVARTNYCDYPVEVKNIKSIGTLKDPSIETIVELKPDIVIASTHFSKEVLSKLESLNIKVVVLYGEETFDGVYSTISKVGSILNGETAANKVISDMKIKVEAVKSKVNGKDKPKVHYVVGYGKYGDFTSGKDTFINQIIEMSGAVNSAGDITGWKYSVEKLVEKNPDILICSKYDNSKEGIKATPGYKELSAVKTNKLFEIDNNLLDRQGPRIADGLEQMAKLIHPDAFK